MVRYPEQMLGLLRQLIAGDVGSLDNDPDDHQLATVLRCHVGDDRGQHGPPIEVAAAGTSDRWNRSAASAIRFSRGEVVAIDDDGNGLTALFDSPGRAIRAAGVLISSAEQAGFPARCGLHCAEVRRRGDEVAGVGVEIGAAIAGQARAGEVWVSRTVTDLVAGNGLRFSDEGEHRLDAIEQPWHLYSLDAVADVAQP